MSNSIVVYYTWAGHTREMAKIIAAQIGADVREVLPETPYTTNYSAVVEQAKKEINAGFRPPIKKLDLDLSKYDVVYIGTPIWWGTMAPPIATF
ncbi:flavodoxin [Desulfotruncus alcoholivorax]|uniref:flavodoxin n=1 Tax=Desulfotruncus alcoholivorax TaxID=265477 RepID=UPI0009D6A690|nr:flavodoxin [Desulfotruncus alcoholivorax]